MFEKDVFELRLGFELKCDGSDRLIGVDEGLDGMLRGFDGGEEEEYPFDPQPSAAVSDIFVNIILGK